MALAIANRYAAALDDVLARTGQSDAADGALAQLTAFAAAMGQSSELRNVFASPSVSATDKRSIVDAICQRIEAIKPVRNLLCMLSDRRRMTIVGDIAEAFGARLDQRRGIARVEVTSAVELGEPERNLLLQKFQKITGKQTEAEYTIDENLLGGAVVRVEGQVFDGSILAQLRALGRSMAGGR